MVEYGGGQHVGILFYNTEPLVVGGGWERWHLSLPIRKLGKFD